MNPVMKELKRILDEADSTKILFDGEVLTVGDEKLVGPALAVVGRYVVACVRKAAK